MIFQLGRIGFVVARDGIEPPTPAFSGPPAELPWFEINGCHLG